MTTLTWDDLWEIGTALNVRIHQVEESMKVLSQYEDIVAMQKKEIDRLKALEAKVEMVRMETL